MLTDHYWIWVMPETRWGRSRILPFKSTSSIGRLDGHELFGFRPQASKSTSASVL